MEIVTVPYAPVSATTAAFRALRTWASIPASASTVAYCSDWRTLYVPASTGWPFTMTLADLRHSGIHPGVIVEEDALRDVHALVR